MSHERAQPARVLIVATSHDELGQTGHKTGLWLEEAAAPCRVFVEAGFTVTVASPKGGPVPLDPNSLAGDFLTPEARAFRDDPMTGGVLDETLRLADVRAENFDALFFAGGHGTMWDFFPNAEIARLLAAARRDGKPVAAVCHGVVALLNGDGGTGAHPLAGLPVTGFSNAEEVAVGLAAVVPHLLEQSLRNVGAEYRSGPAFGPYVVEGPLCLTGQNPASSAPLAQALVQLLQVKQVPA